MDLGILTEKDVEQIEEEVKADIQAAFEEIENLPWGVDYDTFEKTAIAEL